MTSPDLKFDQVATLVYDGECPFCATYTKHLRLREACGPVELIDARHGGLLVERLVADGYDLDEGMALVLDDRVYHGDDCIHALALMTSPSNMFNRLNSMVFRSPRLSALLYPVLRGCRNAVLRLMGRQKIHSAAQ